MVRFLDWIENFAFGQLIILMYFLDVQTFFSLFLFLG